MEIIVKVVFSMCFHIWKNNIYSVNSFGFFDGSVVKCGISVVFMKLLFVISGMQNQGGQPLKTVVSVIKVIL